MNHQHGEIGGGLAGARSALKQPSVFATASKLPMISSGGGAASALPQPLLTTAYKKRQRPVDDTENVEPLTKKFEMDVDSGHSTHMGQNDVTDKDIVVSVDTQPKTTKMIAVVKPAIAASAIAAANKSVKTRTVANTVNKLKRRSIVTLNNSKRQQQQQQTASGSSAIVGKNSISQLSAAAIKRPAQQQIVAPKIVRSTSSSSNFMKPTISNAGKSVRENNRNRKRSSAASRGSNASSINEEQPVKIVKKSRPGWDLKGRLADMEEAMKIYQQTASTLQNRVCSLETQKSTLESTVQEKHIYSQATVAELENVSEKLRQKTADFDESERKSAKLRRDNDELRSELLCCKMKIDELSATVSRMSAAQLSTTLELESTKTEFSNLKHQYDMLLNNYRKLTRDNASLQEELKLSEEKLRQAEMKRRELHNSVQELKGNIRVFCRVRPFLPNEIRGPADFSDKNSAAYSHIAFPSSDKTVIDINKDKCGTDVNESTASIRSVVSTTGMSGISKRDIKHSFSFDRVFEPDCTQKDVFEEISQLIQSAIDGYNVCIFAYGQTGSGKTYTMQGPEEEDTVVADSEHAGMIPLSVKQIFESVEELKSKGWDYQFEASYLEIYNEKIRDLLTEQSNEDQNLEIKFIAPPPNVSNSNVNNSNNTKGQEIYVPGLTVASVQNSEQVHDLIALAVKKRAMAATKCNNRSSRSHAVFRLRIKGSNVVTGVNCDGTLTLVDLAGSERLKESESVGDRLKETQNINKSLSTLGQVIMSLAQKEAHVPYRNSKLTFLLQTYLGGNSKTLMFVNISPSEDSINETINSLRFASKVNQCHIGAAYKK